MLSCGDVFERKFKKSDKQILENYQPVSLLPICGKVFERLIYNSLFEYFIQSDLISPYQSGFKPGDSCTNQLISITHEIYQSFDDGFEVRGVFLDISKAFDKVWHEGLIYKLKQNGVAGDLLDTLTNFLKERKQRVVLNGQYSTWTNAEAGVPQGSILGPLLFLLYINDLPENLVSNPKLFADDTSLFSVIRNKYLSAQNLNEDLNKINHWAFQWKMSFNPDPSKQVQEVIFSRKLQKLIYPPLHFNNIAVTQSTTQKHLGILLDVQLDFQGHLKNIYSKVNKTIGLLRKLHNILPRLPLLTIYKSFIRPHLDYGDIIYDQAYTALFHQKIESVQYNSALAITGAIRGTSKEKIYHELGLESLEKRRWYRKLCCFYKIFRSKSSQYLFNIIPTSVRPYNTRNANNIPQFEVKHNFFKNSFFPSVVIEWNKLDLNIRNSENLFIFKKKLLEFIRPSGNSVFKCHNPKGIKLLTRLRLGLSHLREHKFKHGFLDSLNPICSCGQNIETSTHFLLHCSNYSNERLTFLNIIRNIDSNILNKNDLKVTETLLYGDSSYDDTKNTLMNATMEFLFTSKRFDVPLV